MTCLLLSALILLLSAVAMPAAPPTDADLDASIARNRQGVLVIRARPGTQIRVEQLKHEFWFGATLPGSVFNGRASAEDTAKFRQVFLSHFNAGVIESAFKWHDMEKEQGKVDYSIVDSMLDWADVNGLPLRGHCIFWGVPKYVQPWVKELADGPLRTAIAQRGRSITARYRDRFAEYDLNNEMIHADYYAQRLGPALVKEMALWARDGDPKAKLFFNDYDIATGKRLDDYVKDIRRILDLGAPMSGIGVQGHLHGDEFDAEALQNALNVLAQFHLPIRITEFNFPGQRSRHYQKREDVLTPEEEQAKAAALTQYFRICFAHPAVTGIMMWGFWEGANWIPQSSLFKRDWTPTAAGLAYEQLVLKKWWTNWQGTAGADGTVAVPAYFGKHRVTAGGREILADLTKAKGATVIDLQ